MGDKTDKPAIKQPSSSSNIENGSKPNLENDKTETNKGPQQSNETDKVRDKTDYTREREIATTSFDTDRTSIETTSEMDTVQNLPPSRFCKPVTTNDGKSLIIPIIVRSHSRQIPYSNSCCETIDANTKSTITQLITPKSLYSQALKVVNERVIIDFHYEPAMLEQMAHDGNRLRAESLPNVNNNTNQENELRRITSAPIQEVSPELTPPNSLMSAPPSYSFVLRQLQTRRTPRHMGHFVASPSFVQKIPPPSYAAAFDMFVEPPPNSVQTRIYEFGFSPILVICPECGTAGLTITKTKITLCTHMVALVLCIFCCWVCAPLPYIVRTCKEVKHYCSNCMFFLGMYSPSSAEYHTTTMCSPNQYKCVLFNLIFT